MYLDPWGEKNPVGGSFEFSPNQLLGRGLKLPNRETSGKSGTVQHLRRNKRLILKTNGWVVTFVKRVQLVGGELFLIKGTTIYTLLGSGRSCFLFLVLGWRLHPLSVCWAVYFCCWCLVLVLVLIRISCIIPPRWLVVGVGFITEAHNNGRVGWLSIPGIL